MKLELVGFADRWGVGFEGKRGIKDGSKIFGVSKAERQELTLRWEKLRERNLHGGTESGIPFWLAEVWSCLVDPVYVLPIFPQLFLLPVAP